MLRITEAELGAMYRCYSVEGVYDVVVLSRRDSDGWGNMHAKFLIAIVKGCDSFVQMRGGRKTAILERQMSGFGCDTHERLC